jgi:hypothetical protein
MEHTQPALYPSHWERERLGCQSCHLLSTVAICVAAVGGSTYNLKHIVDLQSDAMVSGLHVDKNR